MRWRRLRRYLLEGIVIAANVDLLMLLQGKPQISGFPGRTMVAPAVPLSLLRALFLDKLSEGGCKKWCGLHLPRW